MKSHQREPTEYISWNIMFLCGVFLYGSHGVLLNLSKVNGKIPFSSMSVVFFIEFSKLLLSVLMFLPEVMNGYKIKIPSLKQFLMYSIPAILYAVNQNIVVHILSYMDPASFQVLGNLKIVCSAVLYRVLLHRPISSSKWVAFIMITIAGAFNSYGGWISNQNSSNDSEKKIHVTLFGMILLLIYCFISGTAGVYTEYILKKQAKLSFAIQSIMLYSFGVGFNFGAFFMSNTFSSQNYGSGDVQGVGEMFEGYSVWTFIIIITQAINGIIIGAIMKHASNLTRLILMAGAMLVGTSLSIIIFSLQFNIYFSVAFLMVIIAMYIYYRPST